VDLPPNDLLNRLRDGQIFIPEVFQPASGHFFKRTNLDAFREMALRITLDCVNAQFQANQRGITTNARPIQERLMVCVSSSPSSAQLVRTAHRMAKSQRLDWIAVYVENTLHSELVNKDKETVGIQNLRMAERLGAETTILTGTDFAEEVLTFAQDKSVTKILVGKPPKPSWKNFFSRSKVKRLLDKSGKIEIILAPEETDSPTPKVVEKPKSIWEWKSFAFAFMEMIICTAVNEAIFLYMNPDNQVLIYVNQIMVYLLGIVILSASQGILACVTACVLNVLAFDFFFTLPRFEFYVYDYRFYIIFTVMLVVGLVIGNLNVRMKIQTRLARLRERRTEALYSLSRELASTHRIDELLETAMKHISEVFDSSSLVFLPDKRRRLKAGVGSATDFSLEPKEIEVAQWAYDSGQMAGKGTDTLPNAQALYVPLLASGEPVGVLGVKSRLPDRLFIPEQLHLLEAFAQQTAMGVLGDKLVEEKQQVQVEMEKEKLRSSLLSSISHDLRTPLATIKGAIGALLESGENMGAAIRKDFLENVHDETGRLERLVTNLLEMTRLEAGAIEPKKEPNDPLDIIGMAVGRIEKRMEGRKLEMNIPPDMPLVPMDGLLIGQVITNLLDNALKYTPEGSPLEISSWIDKDLWVAQVSDKGPGVPEQDLPRLFNKFYQNPLKEKKGGSGLGLAICKGIIDIHGGTLTAENRPDGGMSFRLSLPLEMAIA
jgi:two-component system sensor histidine kinase KdpD